jgi:hypothetical protein
VILAERKIQPFPSGINEIRSRLVDGRVWLSLNQSIPVILNNDLTVSCFRHRGQGGCRWYSGWTRASKWTNTLLIADENQSLPAPNYLLHSCATKLPHTRIRNREPLNEWTLNLTLGSSDRLCGLMLRVPGYRSRGSGFDSRRYQIF